MLEILFFQQEKGLKIVQIASQNILFIWDNIMIEYYIIIKIMSIRIP